MFKGCDSSLEITVTALHGNLWIPPQSQCELKWHTKPYPVRYPAKQLAAFTITIPFRHGRPSTYTSQFASVASFTVGLRDLAGPVKVRKVYPELTLL
jgi:hypothetical protein